MNDAEGFGPTTRFASRNSPAAVDGDAPSDVVRPSAGPVHARIRLRTPGAAHQVNPFVHGGWWPRSTDLVHELPDLLDAARTAGFDTHRVVYGPSIWDRFPRSPAAQYVFAGSDAHRVALDRCSHQPPDTIALVDQSGSGRMDLLVIPVGTDAGLAERALAIAGRDGDSDPAAEVLDRAALMAEGAR
jgi:hypothetical protein